MIFMCSVLCGRHQGGAAAPLDFHAAAHLFTACGRKINTCPLQGDLEGLLHIIRTCYISEYYEDILQHKKSFWAAKGDMRMYDVTYAPMIDMKDLYTGQVYTGTRSKWIEYLAQSGYDIMQNLQISGNDMIGNGVTPPRHSRRYWFYDEKGRTYDARLWSKEIEKTREEWLRSR